MLAAGTTLRVRFVAPYFDGSQLHAREHTAELDTTTGAWKPAGAPAGTPFLVPGAAAGEPSPPPCRLQERQVYVGGGGQSFEQSRVRLLETGPGEWAYSSAATEGTAGVVTYGGFAVTYGGEEVTYAGA